LESFSFLNATAHIKS
ncbi:hypothetical protein CP8484711_2230B, partial [Chlamydia psittaci 84-8471/1]